MTPAEREKLRQAAEAAGLTKLNDAQLAEFGSGARSMSDIVKRLPKDLAGADEMALVFRLAPRNGAQR